MFARIRAVPAAGHGRLRPGPRLRAQRRRAHRSAQVNIVDAAKEQSNFMVQEP